MGAARPPWRALAGLTLAVVLLHLAFLGGVPISLGRHVQVQATAPFSTRTITPPVERPAAPAPAPAARPAPRPVSPAPPMAAAATAAPAAPAEYAAATSIAGASPAAIAAPSTPPPVETPAPTPPVATAAEPAPPEPLTPPQPVQPPPSVRLKYMVQGQSGVQPLSGVAADLTWRNEGGRYEARLAFSFLFRTLRSQVSTGRLTDEGLQPERFGDTRRSEVAAHFEREKGKISFSLNTPEAPLLPGAQDRVSVFFQLAGLMAAQPGGPPAAGTAYTIQTVGPRDAAVWNFVVGEPERLRLPIGVLDTVHLVREPRNPYDQKVEAWFAPSLGWLPVRLKIVDANGDMADQQLRATEAP